MVLEDDRFAFPGLRQFAGLEDFDTIRKLELLLLDGLKDFVV